MHPQPIVDGIWKKIVDGVPQPREPRLCIGQEYLWMQGFPIEIIVDMKGEFSDKVMTDLAGNMCTTPVLLAVLCVAIASPTWVRLGLKDLDLDSEHVEIETPPKCPGFFDITFGPPVPASEMT